MHSSKSLQAKRNKLMVADNQGVANRMVADSQGVATMHQLMSVFMKSDRIETDSSKCNKLMGLGFSG